MKATTYFESRGRSDESRGIHWTRGLREMKGMPQWARDAYIHGNVVNTPWKCLLNGLPSNGEARP